MSVIFLHHLRDHLRSLRFQVSLVLVVLLFAANGVIYTWRAQRLSDLTPYVEADVERNFADLEDLNELVSRSLRLMNRRLPTEFIAEGGASWFGDAFWVELRTGGDFFYSPASRSTNHWMRRYEGLDWAWIVRLVISLLCLVLAYDGFSREREQGTLMLVLAQPLSRGRLLLGKFLAHLTVVLTVGALGSGVSILILWANGVLALEGEIGWAWLGFMGGTALLASLFLLLALGMSALAGRSSTALVGLVLVWAVFMVVLPQTSYLAAVRTVELPADWKKSLRRYVAEVEAGLREEGVALRPRAAAALDGYSLERRYLARLTAGEREGVQRLQEASRRAVRQYEVARRVNMLSPGYAFQYALEGLLGAGLPKYRSFERQAWAYRETLRDWVRAREAADPESPHLLFLPGYLSEVPLDGRPLPRFQEQRLPVGEGVLASRGPLLLLVLETAGAFFFALWAVQRMEVGS